MEQAVKKPGGEWQSRERGGQDTERDFSRQCHKTGGGDGETIGSLVAWSVRVQLKTEVGLGLVGHKLANCCTPHSIL